ncbi:MAG: diguanylate cyclase [Acidobacteria bacterium]|nr:diguanylate cyclase [Acidobacteriota bacterium]
MARLHDLVEIQEPPRTRFAEADSERAARLAAMWARAAEMFREPELFRQILDEIDEGVCFVGRGDRVLFWNRAAEEISGYAGGEMVGRDFGAQMLHEWHRHGCDRCALGCPARATAQGRTLRRSNLFLRHKEGHAVAVRMRRSPMLDARARVVGEVRLFRAACDGLACVDRLSHLGEPALVDRLTGFGNRRFAEGGLTEALARQQREGRGFAVLLADLDGLADVNWIRGQAAGDTALRVASASLAAALRRFDLLARWGDSAFAVIIEGLEPSALACLAHRLSELVAWSRVRDEAGEFSITLSVGGCHPSSGDSVDTLMRRAEANLRQAKNEGRGLVCIS